MKKYYEYIKTYKTGELLLFTDREGMYRQYSYYMLNKSSMKRYVSNLKSKTFVTELCFSIDCHLKFYVLLYMYLKINHEVDTCIIMGITVSVW